MIIYDMNLTKRTTIARFEGDRNYWAKSLHKMGYKIIRYGALEYENIPIRDIVDKVLDRYPALIGKAVCSSNDTWSASEGKRIAKQRLLDKWYRVKDSVLEELQEYIDKRYETMTDHISRRLGRW